MRPNPFRTALLGSTSAIPFIWIWRAEAMREAREPYVRVKLT